MTSFWARLRSPFPEPEYKGSFWVFSIGVSLFISLFLILFQPFGLYKVQHPYKIALLAGFGAVTFVCILMVEGIQRWVFKSHRGDRFLLIHWIFNAMGTLLLIATGNYMYLMSFNNFQYTSWAGFFQMMGYTALIGLFPIVFGGLMGQMRLMKKNQRNASSVNKILDHKSPSSPTQKKIRIEGQNLSEHWEGEVAQLAFIAASDNYVTLHYLESDKHQKRMIRSSMTQIEKQLAELQILRCHRSFMVNMDRVKHVEGNAQGLKLELSGMAEQIPVSRKYIPVVKAALEGDRGE